MAPLAAAMVCYAMPSAHNRSTALPDWPALRCCRAGTALVIGALVHRAQGRGGPGKGSPAKLRPGSPGALEQRPAGWCRPAHALAVRSVNGWAGVKPPALFGSCAWWWLGGWACKKPGQRKQLPSNLLWSRVWLLFKGYEASQA
jgi:hypothetical protein